MKGLRATLLLCYLAVSSLIAHSQTARADEPVYQGRTLTSWLQDFPYGNYALYDFGSDVEKQRIEKYHAAERAIQALGAKALPLLLDRVATISSAPVDSDPSRRALYELFAQISHTQMAFTALGTQARPAIPDLIKLLTPAYEAAHQSEIGRLKDMQANAAASILRGMGGAAIPPVIGALSSKDREVRFGVAMTLGDFHSHAKEVIPSLIKALEDQDKDVRWRAARSIGDLRQMPDVSVPALAKIVRDDPEGNVRSYAIMALGKFGADATASIPDLNKATSDPEPFIGYYAQEALKMIRAAAQKTAVP
jgi:HEAT repeat protein